MTWTGFFLMIAFVLFVAGGTVAHKKERLLRYQDEERRRERGNW